MNQNYSSEPGVDGIIKKIRNRVGTENPIYLSIDIDTLDPACKTSLFHITSPRWVHCLFSFKQSHRQPEPQRLEAGLHESWEQLSEV